MNGAFAPVVDANVHLVGSTRRPDAPPDAGGAWERDWLAGRTLTLEQYASDMAAAGIDRAVLTTTVRHDRFDNTYTATSAATDRERFAFVGNLDVLASDALATLEEWAGRFAMRGVRLYGGRAEDSSSWLGHPAAEDAFSAAGRLGLVVSAQRSRASALGPLQAIVDRFPEVPVVLYSAGDPTFAQAGASDEVEEVCKLALRPNVVVLLSPRQILARPGSGLDPRPLLERLVDAFGTGRMMWGSYSMFAGARLPGPGESLRDVTEEVQKSLAFLGASDQALVLGGTADRLFWPAAAGGSSRAELGRAER